MSSSHELAELAAAEALASSLDVSDSEEEDSDESAGPEAVTFPKAVPPAAHFEAEESRLEINSTESGGAGRLTDLFLSVDSGSARFTQAHVIDVEEEEEDEDDVEEVEEEYSRRTGSDGDTGAFKGKENIRYQYLVDDV
jgi:hypothetical protein